MVCGWFCTQFNTFSTIARILENYNYRSNFTVWSLSSYKAGFDVLQLHNSSENEIKKASVDADGWIVRSGTKINEKMIQAAKKLKAIGRAGVGVDNIDIDEATRKGVIVMNTPDVNTISAAEHSVAMMLALSRNIAIGDSEVKRKVWKRHLLIGSELRGKVLGLVGMGKIGKEVMSRCISFGMNILGYDPYVNEEMFKEKEVKIVDLDQLTKMSDFISIHVPLNADTKDLLI